jgi:radical SAM superfamily enzyme YgiQ (UPF0313 family)
MIVTASLDLSQGGEVKGYPEDPTDVLIYAGDDVALGEIEQQLVEALEAIANCRLIREGHVFSTEIQHAVSAGIVKHLYAYRMGEDGEIWTEETGRHLP